MYSFHYAIVMIVYACMHCMKMKVLNVWLMYLDRFQWIFGFCLLLLLLPYLSKLNCCTFCKINNIWFGMRTARYVAVNTCPRFNYKKRRITIIAYEISPAIQTKWMKQNYSNAHTHAFECTSFIPINRSMHSRFRWIYDAVAFISTALTYMCLCNMYNSIFRHQNACLIRVFADKFEWK